MLNRHDIREKIVFALYQHLLLHKDIYECFDDNFVDIEIDDFIRKIRQDIIDNKNNYIDEISKFLVKWSFDRLDFLDQAILIASTSEIKTGVNSKSVVIDEAVIIAKEYLDENKYKYINGVLDKL